MVWHQMERDDLYLEELERLDNDNDECVVIAVILKQDGLSDRAIHHMECRAMKAAATPSGHSLLLVVFREERKRHSS